MDFLKYFLLWVYLVERGDYFLGSMVLLFPFVWVPVAVETFRNAKVKSDMLFITIIWADSVVILIISIS